MSILFDQDAVAAKLSGVIKEDIAGAQVAGIAISEKDAALLHDLIHGALTEASTDVSGVLAPVLAAIVELNTSIGRIVTESGAWRAIFQRFNFSPPETPK